MAYNLPLTGIVSVWSVLDGGCDVDMDQGPALVTDLNTTEN